MLTFWLYHWTIYFNYCLNLSYQRAKRVENADFTLLTIFISCGTIITRSDCNFFHYIGITDQRDLIWLRLFCSNSVRLKAQEIARARDISCTNEGLKDGCYCNALASCLLQR